MTTVAAADSFPPRSIPWYLWAVVFAQSGIYRVWVQVKTELGVETGVWDVDVGKPGAGSPER